MKNYFTKIGILFTCALLVSSVTTDVGAQQKLTRTIEESLGDMLGGHLEIEHRRGDVRIINSTDDQASFKLDILVEGRDKTEIEEFMATFEVSITGSGKSKKIETSDQIKSWINALGRSKVKMENGDVFSGIKSMNFDMIVAIPDLDKVTVSNRYEDIYIEPLSADLTVNLYSGELHANDVDGEVTLDIKYSEATLGSSKNLHMTLYESDINVGNSDRVVINSKYGDLELANLGSLTLSGYEDDLKAGNVMGKSLIEAKYCDLEFEALQETEIDFYETDLVTSRTATMKGTCKYGQLELGEAGNIDLIGDYETEVTATTCTELILHDSKYGDFEIGTLTKKARILSYETTVDVDNIAPQFESLWIESKYEQMSFPLPAGLTFNLDADLRYGDLDYNKSVFNNHDRQEKSNNTIVKATTENAQAKVYIRTYETEVDLAR